MWPATRVGSQLGTRYSSTPFMKGSRSSEPQLSRNGVAGVRLFRFEGAIMRCGLATLRVAHLADWSRHPQPLPSTSVGGIVAFSFLRIA